MPDQIGLVNFAFFVGAAIALVTAGPYLDWVALRKARKNGGVLEAEYRLPALIPYVAISLVGIVITAVGYQRSWPWPAIVVVGYVVVAVVTAVLFSAAFLTCWPLGTCFSASRSSASLASPLPTPWTATRRSRARL
jgi:hypothetical protein